MHSTGYSKELERDQEKWDSPTPLQNYKNGWDSCAEVYEEKTTKLEDEITFKDHCIEELNAKVEELEDVIDELSQTWYIKLWNSIPKISISIIRRK